MKFPRLFKTFKIQQNAFSSLFKTFKIQQNAFSSFHRKRELVRFSNSNNNSENNRNLIYLIGGGIGLLGIFTLSHLETVKESGRRRLIFTSPQTEMALAESSYQSLIREYRNRILDPSHPAVQLVQKVAWNLIKANNLQSMYRWQIHVVNSPEMNAFVLPGGKIFVFTGILPVMQNESGVASVLGHEMAHVLSRHSAEKLSWITLYRIVYFGIRLVGFDPPSFLTAAILNFGLLLPNSRACESEADLIGLHLMAKACYDPNEAAEMWKRMKRIEKNSAANHASSLEFMSTHPSHDSRIHDIQEWIPKALEIKKSNCSDVNSFFLFSNSF